jgi:hypothetical protein
MRRRLEARQMEKKNFLERDIMYGNHFNLAPQIMATVDNILKDLADIKNNGVGSVELDYVRVQDHASIQAAIDYAAENNKKRVVLEEKNYTISSRILVKQGICLEFLYNTKFYVYGTNYNVLELEKEASLLNPNITIDDANFIGNVIYLDGKYKYYNSWYRARVVNPIIVNWTGSYKGTGIYLYAGGTDHEISFVNFENARIVGMDTGVKLKTVTPPSSMAWVNANRFINLTIEDCITMIDIDSGVINTVPTHEASGNFFTGLYLQLSPNTTTAIRVSGQYNKFEGLTWDDALVPAGIKLFRFTAQSADNNMRDLHIETVDRIEDLGNRNVTKFTV